MSDKAVCVCVMTTLCVHRIMLSNKDYLNEHHFTKEMALDMVM